MSNNSLVSCIIIFFNAEEFFEEAIESVFSQSYDNWELLLADDGSTDSSTAIAHKYAQQYPDKVRYVEHESHQNRGMSATRNLGIRNARGKYIAFLDSDDVWLPQKLEQQVAIMESHPEAGMVYGKAIYWFSWTGKPEDIQKDYEDKPSLATNNLYQPPTLLLENHPLAKHGGAPCPSELMIRKEILERVGGCEESFIKQYQFYEDQGFLSKLYLTAPVFISNHAWIKYRLHPKSCSAVVTASGQDESVRFYFLNWLEKYLSDQGIDDTRVWKALQKALFPYRNPLLLNLVELLENFLRQIKVLLRLIAQQLFPTSIYRWLKAQLLSIAR